MSTSSDLLKPAVWVASWSRVISLSDPPLGDVSTAGSVPNRGRRSVARSPSASRFSSSASSSASPPIDLVVDYIS
jgi:hypothetical protein